MIKIIKQSRARKCNTTLADGSRPSRLQVNTINKCLTLRVEGLDGATYKIHLIGESDIGQIVAAGDAMLTQIAHPEARP